MDEIAEANEQLWEELVKEGCGYTVPWLDLKSEDVQKYAKGQLQSVPRQLVKIYPPNVLSGVDGELELPRFGGVFRAWASSPCLMLFFICHR